VQTLRYYFGMRDAPARFDHFDYRQKFEYWGMLLGSAIVAATGLVCSSPS
jgi:cytochrome b subunit of formate dehydrogenase